MRPKHLVTLLVSLVVLLAALPTLAAPAVPAHAGGIVSVCDEAHLLAALAGGGTVTFSCSGTITLTSTITIAADTTIDGSGQTVTLSGNGTVRVFTVNAGVALNLNALTVADGSGGYNYAGGILNEGMLTVTNSTFSGNSAISAGGIYNGGTLIVSNSTFSGNQSMDDGGGILNAGTLIVSNSTFSNNDAVGSDGGGIYNWGGILTVINSTFSNNSGGGIYHRDNTGAVTTLKNTIVANSSYGGNCTGMITDGSGNLSYPDTTCPGIHSDPLLGPLQNNGGLTQTMALLPGSAAIDAANDAICGAPPVNNRDQRDSVRPQGSHCDIGAYEATSVRIVSVCDEAHLLTALAGGGAVTFSCSGTITLTAEIVISADTGIDGRGQTVSISGDHAGRVFTVNPGVSLNLNALTIANGSAVDGGGIYNSGTLKVSNSTFAGNSAQAGGGIYSSGTVAVSNSTFSANSARKGGGIYTSGTTAVSNSTFFANSAQDGGGISVRNGYERTVTISNSTFAGNSALNGGAIYSSNSTVILKNTIAADSPTGGNCAGVIADGSGNLSYPDATCPGINSDPVLRPLQDNGGLTQTMALGTGSAALDAANDAVCAAAPVNNRDQRGITRPQGPHCDIGAYEATLPPRAFLPIIMR